MAIKKMVSEDAVVPETIHGETVKVATIGGKEIKAPVGGGGGGTDADAVHYTAETKTDAQKAQARDNIGAMSADTPIPPETQFDDKPSEGSQKAARSGGIWSWVKSLLPKWLTSDYAEPATVASVEAKADKATTLAGYGITDAATKTELNAKADKSALAAKADKSTTLAGYGITDGATKTELAALTAKVEYPLYAVPSTGVLKDRAINTTSLASVTVPDNFTDLLIRASVASSLSVTMPAETTKYGDTFPGEAGEYLITITKTGAAEAYVRTIKLEEVA